MKAIDFLAIGDVVTDVFIRLKDAEAHCDIDEHNCKLCVRFGDKIPFESAEEVPAVGNSANAAVAAARLGVSSALLAHVGKDYHGEQILRTLEREHVDTALMKSHEGIPTNYHYVLWYDVERTILVKHAAFPYSFPQTITPPKMIYLSSLGENSLEYHHEIAAYCAANPEVKLIFQPGTFQIKQGTETLQDIYRATYAFFCNLEEAQRILGTEAKDPAVLMTRLHTLGPKIVCITDGMNGAYASDGKEQWFMPIYPHDPVERTGAGDAFASTVSVGLLLGHSLPDALRWGPINSMSVVQYVGAQKGLLTQEKIKGLLAQAPLDYQPKHVF
jgi:ribokinase